MDKMDVRVMLTLPSPARWEREAPVRTEDQLVSVTWGSPSDTHHGRGSKGSRFLSAFLAPAMLARMRRDAVMRLDFP